MPRQSSGFTLIELLVTVTVIGILTAIALPNFATTIQNTKADTEISDFQRTLNYARQEAINRGIIIRVTPVTAGAAWSTVLQVIDPSTTPVTVFRNVAAMDTTSVLTVAGNPTSIDFNNLGGLAAPYGLASLLISYTRGTATRTINICLSGRIVLGGVC